MSTSVFEIFCKFKKDRNKDEHMAVAEWGETGRQLQRWAEGRGTANTGRQSGRDSTEMRRQRGEKQGQQNHRMRK